MTSEGMASYSRAGGRPGTQTCYSQGNTERYMHSFTRHFPSGCLSVVQHTAKSMSQQQQSRPSPGQHPIPGRNPNQSPPQPPTQQSKQSTWVCPTRTHPLRTQQHRVQQTSTKLAAPTMKSHLTTHTSDMAIASQPPTHEVFEGHSALTASNAAREQTSHPARMPEPTLLLPAHHHHPGCSTLSTCSSQNSTHSAAMSGRSGCPHTPLSPHQHAPGPWTQTAHRSGHTHM
jgi:hypothetical protein